MKKPEVDDNETDEEPVDFGEPLIVASKIRSMLDEQYQVYENGAERAMRDKVISACL